MSRREIRSQLFQLAGDRQQFSLGSQADAWDILPVAQLQPPHIRADKPRVQLDGFLKVGVGPRKLFVSIVANDRHSLLPKEVSLGIRRKRTVEITDPSFTWAFQACKDPEQGNTDRSGHTQAPEHSPLLR